MEEGGHIKLIHGDYLFEVVNTVLLFPSSYYLELCITGFSQLRGAIISSTTLKQHLTAFEQVKGRRTRRVKKRRTTKEEGR